MKYLNKEDFPHHLIESGVPGFPGDLGLAFGSLMWIWKQVGFHVWVGISSFFRNLKGGAQLDECDSQHRKQQHLRTSVCVYQISDVHDHDEQSAVPVGDGELHLSLHPTRRGTQWRLRCFGRGVQTFGLVVSCDWMKEGVDQVTLEPETMRSSTGREPQHVPTQFTESVCVCVPA